MAGVDEALKGANRSQPLGITGWSYGGFITMWPSPRPTSFKAAMREGLSNWQSYYGQNLIDQWIYSVLSPAVYDYPEIYAKVRQSISAKR